MKQYIRTKNGIIKVLINCFNPAIKENLIKFLKEQDDYIIKEADNIEDLIMVGDLTNLGFITCVYNEEKMFGLPSGWVFMDSKHNGINELYTKQGDNYVLVWTKEKGVIECYEKRN